MRRPCSMPSAALRFGQPLHCHRHQLSATGYIFTRCSVSQAHDDSLGNNLLGIVVRSNDDLLFGVDYGIFL